MSDHPTDPASRPAGPDCGAACPTPRACYILNGCAAPASPSTVAWIEARGGDHGSRPDDIRSLGWTVAVHNDYRLSGISHTFWLFTKDGEALKGEGRTDAEALDQIREQIGLPTAADPAHSDDLAVDRFAVAMKAKLAAKRGEGRGGWDNPDECKVEYLAQLLCDHVQKGDPVDVANFAMMLHQRQARRGLLAKEFAAFIARPVQHADVQLAVAHLRALGSNMVDDREFSLSLELLIRAATAVRHPLTLNRIAEIASSMPGGMEGFTKGWGWKQFAEAIEMEHGIGEQPYPGLVPRVTDAMVQAAIDTFGMQPSARAMRQALEAAALAGSRA